MGERYVAFVRLCWSSESADAWRRRTFFLNITRKRAELSPAPALCGTYLPVRSKERFGSRRTPCSRTFRKKKRTLVIVVETVTTSASYRVGFLNTSSQVQ